MPRTIGMLKKATERCKEIGASGVSRNVLGVLFILLFCAVFDAEAHQVAVSTSYERWSWSGADASELFTEVRVGLEATRDVFLDLASGHARVTGEGAPDLSGVVDTRASLTYRREALILRLGVNGPTGKTELSSDETLTAGLLADRVLSLPSRILGRGLDVDATAAYSVALEDVVLGFSAGYLLRDDFRPFEGSTYEPGDRVSGTVAAELGSSRWKWRSTVKLGYTFADVLDGEEYVRNGFGFTAETLGLKRWVGWSLWARLSYHDFGDPDILFSPVVTAADFAGRSRRDVALAVGSRTHVSTRGAFDASVGTRLLSGAAFEDGAQRFDVEGRYTHRVTPSVQLGLGASLGYARLNDASLQLQAADGTDLTGAEVSLEIRSRF